MKGTDRTSSIMAVQIILIIGKLEVRPKASMTPKGKDIAIPKNAKTQVKAKPPQIEEPGTTIRVSEVPPLISKIKIVIATDQTINKLLADSLEFAIVGATEIKIHNRKKSSFNCLSTGSEKTTTANLFFWSQ